MRQGEPSCPSRSRRPTRPVRIAEYGILWGMKKPSYKVSAFGVTKYGEKAKKFTLILLMKRSQMRPFS